MVVNLNETSMADKSPVTDGTAGVNHDSPEDGNELHVGSKPETKHPFRPEVPVNRRKMGSNRRNKGKQNVQAVESKSNQKFGEEVKEMTESTALIETTQKVARQRIVHVSEASEDHSLITSGHQSGVTFPYLKEGKGLEVDSDEIKEDSHNVGPSELSSKDVLSHSLDKQLSVMSPNLRQGEMQSNERDDMQWFTENEKCFKRSLNSTTREEPTDKSSPCDRTDELVGVDKSYSSTALFHPSIFRDHTENTVKENTTSLDVEGQAEYQDNFQNKQVKSVMDHSGNKNTGERQVMEEDDMENWNSGVNQPHSHVDAMFSPEVNKNSMTNIVVSNLKSLNPKSGYVQDQHQMETNFENERSDKSLETKIKGLDKSTEQPDSAQLEDKAGNVPEKEVKPTQIQQTAQRHHTFERVTDDVTDSDTFCSSLTDQAHKMYKPEINQISTHASAPISHSLIKECVESNVEKTRLQDTNLSEIECKNNTSQILPSELHNPINFQQKCPNTQSHPETVSEKNVEKPVKHFSGDESTVGTLSLEQLERKSDDWSNTDIQSASCDGFVQLEKPGEVTLKKMDESEDCQMLQAVQIVKASAQDANNGTHISEINLKNVTNDAVYEDKDFKNIAKTEDSVEVKQDAHSDSHVEILTSAFIGQIIESSLTNCVDSVDFMCTSTTNTKDHKELEQVLPQAADEHSNLSSSDIRETQRLDSFEKTSENVVLVDSTLQSQSGKSGSDTGLKIRNRRKLGSSRKNKGSEQVNIVTEKDNAVKNEGVETTELEEQSSGLEYSSQRNEKPKNSSEEDNNENENNEIDTRKDQSTEILGQLTGTDTFMDSMESFQASVLTDIKPNTQGISSNNDGDDLKHSEVDVTDQEEVCKAQSGTSLCNKHSPEKSTENMKQTVKLVKISCSQNTNGSKNGDVGLYCEDRMNKTHTCGELNPSPSVVVSGTETWAVNEPDGCTTSISNDSSNSIHQIKTYMDGIMSDKKSGQQQRALGTTQKLQPNSKHNEGMEKDEMPQSTLTAENKYLLAPAEETILKTNQITSAQDMSNDLQCSSTDLQIIDRNLIPIINDLNSLLTEQSAFPRVEEVVNLEPCSSKVADVKETERMDVSLRTSQLDSFTNTEVQMSSEENTCSVSQTDKNTQSVRGSSPITESPTSHNENEIGENLKIEQINKVDEKAQSLTSEIEVPSITSKFVNRRKMGSNRKKPNFFAERDEFFPKEEENEATERKTTTDSEQTQLHCIAVKQGEEQGKEGVSETVEHKLNTESYLNPKIQQTDEGNPTPPSQQGETKDQLDPGFFPSPSSESQTLSEQASIGRRRKLGSHRKSHGQNYNEDQSAKTFYMEHQSRVRSDPDDDKTKATESDCQDKVPKDDESSKTPLSSFALTKNGENSIIIGKQTSVQPLEAGKDIQNKIPLTGIPKEVETSTNHYNVLMIGDTSVGKTSFIKRAQSGKFSLAVPSSVGLDTCKWTVMVDGKPVVLHVWDTAGQERFRSITRQIFHRAQAFVLMYDISSSHSFSAVSYWANCIQDSAGENVIILLVGNKCDRAERQVRREEGENLAKEHKFAFSECSAASGENVVECLETVARMLSQRSGSKRDATLLHNKGGKTKRSTCC